MSGRPVCQALRVDAALLRRVGNAIDRQHVCRNTIVHTVRLGVANNIDEALDHDAVEAIVNLLLGPEIAHAILHPLKIAGGNATRVRKDVRHHEDAVPFEDFVRFGSRWAVCSFDKDACS